MTSLSSVRGSAALIPRRRSQAADVAVFVGVAAVLWLVVRTASGATVPWTTATAAASVSTDPSALPYFAARSLLRMFVALGLSVAFALVYATAAARIPGAAKVLLPLLDVLQSVPILGFLSVTVTGFIALFPGSQLGLECASIFAIFTSQAWNLAFALHHSLTTQPRELDEAARLLRLSRWQRFWRVDVPSGMIPLVWNGMMSFGGGWFFLTASEALSVNGRQVALPGIGAYVAAAGDDCDLGRVSLAVGVMVVMIVAVNALFWRPLTVWSGRFRIGDAVPADAPGSALLTVLRRSHLPRLLRAPLTAAWYALDRVASVSGVADRAPRPPSTAVVVQRRAAGTVLSVVLAYGGYRVLAFLEMRLGLAEVGRAATLGLLTFGRVIVVMLDATLLWVPVGVWIGLNARVTRLAQPVVQVLASFPANFLFPLVTAALIATHVGLGIGGILLMALGSQWYVLFNVIAGASAIPYDLREAATILGLSRRARWRTLIGPAVFPSYVTGAITAAGGAWNASIVAEVVSYHGSTLTARGLGSYVADATAAGDGARTLLGVLVMSAFVVATNRLFWRPVHALAQRRYAPT
ncbi:ABC transporter permease [Mycolicibacterium grossiae]|uniref:Sulfonate ABC transporter permease n=1 Tax=Mycolicibacterium grossiae TaxID=1552759 RepID=A0A1E8QAS9_9MYCO|nr:ABC transporter permease subunit [Mycolicibacterium grossiae]OFJ55516.1 sulfonate ABC transporter permease [Mycolicibacterium grossiae]QEM45145.1 ABC transporter permease subunit [Mycolicibacterium grossiae]